MIEKGISLFEEGSNELSFNFESKDVRFSVDQLIKVTLDSNCYYNIKITRVTELSENVFKIKGIDVTPPFIKKMSNALRPEKTISVREWSDTYRYLDSSASSMPGKYSTELTPFLREPLESLTINNGVELVAFMKSAQIGASEAGNNFIGYIIDIAPASTMVVLPTADLAKQFSKERISPLVSATPRLKSKIKNDVRNSDNTVLMKKFEGGFIKLVGANSATNLRSTPIKFLFFDEVDAYPFDVDGEGSPIELALKRTTTFKRRKIFMASTPTVKHFSNIEEYFLRGDQRHFFLPCPHCQVAQHLEFKQLKYRVNANNKQIADPDSVYYECKHCKEEIYESSKTKMMNLGQWIATNKDGDPKIRSYHINSLYSPLGWKSWLEIINEYLVAKEDQDKMKTFWNTTLGLPYTDETHKPDARKLEKRKSSWREWTCPDDVVYINAGVDTQDDRLAVVVVGYGKNNQHYIIGYEEIDGDPNQPDVWEKLKLIIDKPIMHDSGLEMFVKDVAVDSGGHRTAYVYDFCRADKEKYIPIKGRSFDGATSMKRSSIVDKDLVNKDTGDALYLYLVNNNYNKKLIYQYLGNESPGRNYFHFNHDLPSNFFDMLCSEELVVKFVKGQRKEEFTTGVKGMGARNEALDCVNYSFALARNNQIHRLVDEKKYAEYYDMNVTQKLKALEKMKNGEPVKPKLPPRPSKFNNGGGSRFSSNRR